MATINVGKLFGMGVTDFNTAPVKEASLPQPEAFEVVGVMDEGEFAAYERTCQAIGFEPAALLEAQIIAFMAEKKIKRYDATKVDDFLAQKAKKALGQYGYWYWRPLRAADVGNATITQSQKALWSIGVGNWNASVVPYQATIPLRVLGRVEQFVQKFGDKVRFLVSDYAEKRPDPFIAVVPKNGGEPIIFDMWDEPDFK